MFKSLIQNQGGDSERTKRYKKEYEHIKKAITIRDPFTILLLTKIYKAPTSLEFDPTVVEKTVSDSIEKLATGITDNQLSEALEILKDLHGVEMPVATAFLHFHYPEIPIIDIYAYAVYLSEGKKLNVDKIKSEIKLNKKYTISEYLAFRKFFNFKYGDLDAKKANFQSMEDGAKILGRA